MPDEQTKRKLTSLDDSIGCAWIFVILLLLHSCGHNHDHRDYGREVRDLEERVERLESER